MNCGERAIFQIESNVGFDRDLILHARTNDIGSAYLPTLRSGKVVPVRVLPVPWWVLLRDPVSPDPAVAGSRGNALLVFKVGSFDCDEPAMPDLTEAVVAASSSKLPGMREA